MSVAPTMCTPGRGVEVGRLVPLFLGKKMECGLVASVRPHPILATWRSNGQVIRWMHSASSLHRLACLQELSSTFAQLLFYYVDSMGQWWSTSCPLADELDSILEWK
jgi:hypothetical protein